MPDIGSLSVKPYPLSFRLDSELLLSDKKKFIIFKSVYDKEISESRYFKFLFLNNAIYFAR